ncbi:MAG: hypothetical protein Q9217_002602 [Psora testacea]
MSFFFGKKNKGDKAGAAPPTRDGPVSGPSSSSIPTANGGRPKERGAGVSSPASGAKVTNPDGNNTPSPEQSHEQRGGIEHDIQHAPPRSMPTGPPPNVNPAALYPWSQRRLTFTSSPNPFPRYGAAVNAVSSKEGEIYLMGGLVNGSTKGDLWMIEAGGSSFACYTVMTTFEGPGPRVGHASLLVGNAFIVFGGDTKMDERDKLDDTLYLLNTSTRSWSRSMPPGPRPAGRYGHTLNILGSKIYVFGGQVEGYFFNDLIAFDLNALQNSNSKWEMLIQNSSEGGPPEGSIPPARTNHTIVSWNEKLYLFGGTNGTQWFSDVWSYDPKTISWTQLDCIGYIPAAREGHSAALIGDVMYIFGGRTAEGTDLGDLAAFRITSRRWYTFQNMGPSPSPRSGHSMTSFGKQIVVLAGEPSSASRDPGELSLVYILDTGKIRYPNDQQIQQTPTGERVPGKRRPSQERGIGQQMGPPQNRPINTQNGAPDGMNRKYSGSRESIVGPSRGPGPGMGPGPGIRGQDPPIGNGPSPPGPGSRLPRTSVSQASSGPPPQQQAPPPRPNGAAPPGAGPRSRTPTRDGRGYGPSVDTGRGQGFEPNEASPPILSPVGGTGPRQNPGTRAMSPAINGRRTPTQQQPQQVARYPGFPGEDEEPPKHDPTAARSRSRQGIQGHSPMEDVNQFPAPNQQQHSPNNQEDPPNDNAMRSNSQRSEPSVPLQQFQQLQNQHQGLQSQLDGLMSEHESLRSQHQGLRSQQHKLEQELEAAKSRNAWYASELALAKNAGYQTTSSQGETLDDNATRTFSDEERPLVEALVAVRAQLAEVQGSVAARKSLAAEQLAEVEHQRDNAVREAAYARAKLAAHGGSHAGTPQSQGMSRDLGDEDRSGDIGRKLAAALATQNELRATIASMVNDIHHERRARELAEGTAEAAHKRAAEFEGSRNPGELETLRTELHHAGKIARDEAAAKAEAHAKVQLLEVDKEDLSGKLEEALENTKQHSITLVSLHEAVTSSTDKASLFERKLDEERQQRESVNRKLLQLRAEHEERTAELDDTMRKLRDAEEMVATHAAEAKTHRQAVVAGLDKLSNHGIGNEQTVTENERVPILKQQVEQAHALVRKNQADADDAAEKLRRAEERIAGLEAFQEQSSRESLAVRKQLQDAVRESQALQATHKAVQQQLESQQLDARALIVKHNALKELLDERGISESGRSRNMDSPGPRLDTPDDSRVKDLEQQLEASLRAHQEMKETIESREIETEKTYREKLELLENDYQSAVHYVKGTEKMLKRMKDELTKYKKQNERLQSELDTAQHSHSERSLEPEAAAEWEQERQALRREIGELQRTVGETHSQLEAQMAQVQSELQAANGERDRHRQASEQTQQRLVQATQQSRAELEQLKAENNMLEARALDAEQKVTLLLDQVGTSVGNYRLQSQQMHNSANGHSRNLSAISGTSTASSMVHPPPLNYAGGNRGHSRTKSTDTDPSSSFPAVPDSSDGNNRNSLALDSLASELETLRSHWVDTHRTYRLSNQFDFDRSTPTSATGPGNMSDSLANWRKRLDAEESQSVGKHAGAAANRRESSSEGSTERNRDSGVIRPNEKMPGGLGGLSDEESDEGSVDERESRSYVI